MKNKIVIGYATSESKAFRTQYNQELTDSSGLNDHEISIIPYEIDGSLSLTAIYNDIWECAELFKDAIYVFIHDDIYFKSKNWGRQLLDLFNNNEIDIIGVAGADALQQHGNWIRDKKFNFANPNIWGKVWYIRNDETVLNNYTSEIKKCTELQPVIIVDGLFIAFNPETCEKFDEDFDDFHFYDISFCVANYLNGRRIAVTESIQIIHENEETTSDIWEQSRLTFCEKYRAHLPLSVSSKKSKY